MTLDVTLLRAEATGDALAQAAIILAEELLRTAKAQQTPQEHSQAQKIARMMEDPHGKDLTIALADQAFRSHQPARIADQLRHLLQNYGVPRYMEWWERGALALGGVMSHYLQPGRAAHRRPPTPRNQ